MRTLISILIFCSVVAFVSADCNLPYGDPNCECCSENWGGGAPPALAFVVFQDIERTDCDPGWVMLRPPNNRLFILRLSEEFTGNTCAWSYNLDTVGGEGRVESDIWVVDIDLTAYYNNNVYLANKVDDPPADMIYFYHRGLTDCRTVYENELQSWDCGPIFYFWAGGKVKIFWLDSADFGDFNGDGIVNFKDYAILAEAPFLKNSPRIIYQVLWSFCENWLLEPGQL